jgi:hypothetical protein
MATPLSPADIGGLVKKAYAGDPSTQALWDNFAFWKELDQVGPTSGESFTMPVIYQAALRVGSDPATVYAFTQRAPAAKFELTPKRQYGYSSIDGLAIQQCAEGNMDKKGLNAFISAVHEENVAVSKTMAKNHALYATRGGTGSLGNIDASTTLASTTLVLAKKSDEYNFEEGQTLQLAATDGAAPRAGTLVVDQVPGNGTLVLTGNINAGVAAAATGDFIVLAGDGQTQTFAGLKSWCPFSFTKGTFGGVNRALSPRKLAGLFVDAAVEGLTPDAGLSAALNRFKAVQGDATHGWVNPLDWEAIAQSGSSAVTVDQGGDREFGFRSLSLQSDGTKVRIYEDPTFVMGEGWLINMRNIEMRWVGSPGIKIDDRDGLTIRKVPVTAGTPDTWEMTFSTYPYGICMKKGAIPGRTLCGVKLY